MPRTTIETRNLNTYIGKRLRTLRLGKGLSRQELADIVSVTHQQIQKYETGDNRLTMANAYVIAKATGVSLDYFFFGLGDESHRNNTHERMCLEVSRNFLDIKDPTHQTAINQLVKILSKG